MCFVVSEQSCEVWSDRYFKFANEETEAQRPSLTFERLCGDEMADRGLEVGLSRAHQEPLNLKGQG